MEHCGSVGHSSFVGFYADGDGDFRPEFQVSIPFEQKDGIPEKEILGKPEIMFDAGKVKQWSETMGGDKPWTR